MFDILWYSLVCGIPCSRNIYYADMTCGGTRPTNFTNAVAIQQSAIYRNQQSISDPNIPILVIHCMCICENAYVHECMEFNSIPYFFLIPYCIPALSGPFAFLAHLLGALGLGTEFIRNNCSIISSYKLN